MATQVLLSGCCSFLFLENHPEIQRLLGTSAVAYSPCVTVCWLFSILIPLILPATCVFPRGSLCGVQTCPLASRSWPRAPVPSCSLGYHRTILIVWRINKANSQHYEQLFFPLFEHFFFLYCFPPLVDDRREQCFIIFFSFCCFWAILPLIVIFSPVFHSKVKHLQSVFPVFKLMLDRRTHSCFLAPIAAGGVWGI